MKIGRFIGREIILLPVGGGKMHNERLKNNPLATKQDVTEALLEMLRPLENCFSLHGMCYSTGEAQYGGCVAELEALLRPLWGIIPFSVGGGQYPALDKYMCKILEGVNPKSPSYWGRLDAQCQRMVEMATLAVGMCIAKDRFWDALSSKDQDNLYNWLYQINDYTMQVSNWRFFRILVNTAFILCGCEHSQERLDEDLTAVDSLYDSGGWYIDGGQGRRDYYIPFAFHFYGLIYAKVAVHDPIYQKKFIDRATEFAKTFPAFFVDSGEAVPFGRSMAYRFAQGCFWGALAFADVEALPWGQIKFLALQHMRHWLAQDIFTPGGQLSVGYYYPNQVMAEAYNSYGSPYWAFKAFIMLALPDGHPFWQAQEEMPNTSESLVIPQARGILQRDDKQVQYYVVGQNIQSWMSLSQPKYEKFVYSSHFGFSVPKSAIGLGHGAFDNTLAICEGDDEFFRMRYGVENFEIFEDYLYSKWLPWPDVTIESYIVPLFPWHMRLHIVNTGRRVTLADGGFAISRDGYYKPASDDNSCAIIRDDSTSAIVSLAGGHEPQLVWAEPNTNLMVPRTIIPSMIAKANPGKHFYATAVLGAYGANPTKYLENPPRLAKENNGYLIYNEDKRIKITLEKTAVCSV